MKDARDRRDDDDRDNGTNGDDRKGELILEVEGCQSLIRTSSLGFSNSCP